MKRFAACIFGIEGLRLNAEETAFFREVNPFGFILFARNIDTADQVKALCDDLREAVGHDCVITIDQEGGRVQRLRAPQWREWLPPLAFVDAAGAQASRAMYLRYRLIGHELFKLGIDSNCAPMLDVATSTTHEFLRNRCFGHDPREVALLGRAAAEGLLDAGVLPVLKHIPGHGRATADSHFDLPKVSASLEELEKSDFSPFRALNDMPLGMTAHLLYEALDQTPATLSKPVMDLIRQKIGFEGLIMTDDIAMKALNGDLATLSRQSIAAGCDAVLHCNGTLAECQSVACAAGEMNDAAQLRAEKAMAARQTPEEINPADLDAELKDLLSPVARSGLAQ